MYMHAVYREQRFAFPMRYEKCCSFSLTHTLTHTGIAQGGQASSEWTVTSGFSLKNGENP